MVIGFRARSISFAASGLTLCLLLSACGGSESTLQQTLGYDQRGPDAMAVIKRPPLILPPDYNLRPPRAGSQDNAEQSASDAARDALVGTSSAAGEGAAAAGEASQNARDALTGATPSAETEPLADEATKARDILTNGSPSSDASEALTDGQSALISRTDRTERDLDGLTETRAENVVDSALLRRLLSWTPADRPDSADTEAADQAPAAVQVVDRSQTVIEAPSNTSQ